MSGPRPPRPDLERARALGARDLEDARRLAAFPRPDLRLRLEERLAALRVAADNLASALERARPARIVVVRTGELAGLVAELHELGSRVAGAEASDEPTTPLGPVLWAAREELDAAGLLAGGDPERLLAALRRLAEAVERARELAAYAAGGTSR